MTQPYIEAIDVAFSYGGQEPRVALDGVSFRVARGEFVAVLGMNGSGKSTLALHLNALLLPKGGTVTVDGMATSDPDSTWAIRDRVGMVFQNPDNQIVAAVVEEDVAFGPENQGVAPEEIRSRVESTLATVGMTAHRTRPPHQLSGGQKQRVAIAGALALRPVCLVLDEATAMLDPSGRREVLEVVRRLNRDLGMAIIWITHFMDEAALADRVVVMAAGKVEMDGPPRTVFTQVDRLRSLRLDVPPAVSAAAHMRRAGIPLPDDVLTLEELVEALCQLDLNR